MYLKYFGLKEFPFSLTPNTGFFFSYGHYRAALETLIVALDNNEGFIKVTGEVGSGKTQLCRKLINQLDKDEYYTAYIPNPYLTPLSLFQAFAEALKIDISASMFIKFLNASPTSEESFPFSSVRFVQRLAFSSKLR